MADSQALLILKATAIALPVISGSNRRRSGSNYRSRVVSLSLFLMFSVEIRSKVFDLTILFIETRYKRRRDRFLDVDSSESEEASKPEIRTEHHISWDPTLHAILSYPSV